jgi:hypothetical protein
MVVANFSKKMDGMEFSSKDCLSHQELIGLRYLQGAQKLPFLATNVFSYGFLILEKQRIL